MRFLDAPRVHSILTVASIPCVAALLFPFGCGTNGSGALSAGTSNSIPSSVRRACAVLTVAEIEALFVVIEADMEAGVSKFEELDAAINGCSSPSGASTEGSLACSVCAISVIDEVYGS